MSTATHIGTVTKNNDPEKRGRVKVKCPGLVRTSRELPFWLDPKFPYTDVNAGWFFVPKIGAQVEVEAITGAPGDQTRGEASLVAHRACYKAALYSEAQQVPAEFKDNYPNRRGFKTPAGHILLLDDTSGQERFALTDAVGNSILMTTTGVRIVSKYGDYIEWKSTGIDIDGAIAVVRNQDNVTPTAAMILWMSQVAAVCNALVPGSVTPAAPPDFAKAVASSTKVRAG